MIPKTDLLYAVAVGTVAFFLGVAVLPAKDKAPAAKATPAPATPVPGSSGGNNPTPVTPASSSTGSASGLTAPGASSGSSLGSGSNGTTGSKPGAVPEKGR